MKQRSNKYKWNRILKLADFMEKLPRDRFDFSSFVGAGWKGAQDLSCGTTACALGWAPSVPLFRKLGLRLRRFRQTGIVKLGKLQSVNGKGWARIGKRVFNIKKETLDNLFLPQSIWLSSSNRQNQIPSDATPKQWARHARHIVNQLKNGEIE